MEISKKQKFGLHILVHDDLKVESVSPRPCLNVENKAPKT